MYAWIKRCMLITTWIHVYNYICLEAVSPIHANHAGAVVLGGVCQMRGIWMKTVYALVAHHFKPFETNTFRKQCKHEKSKRLKINAFCEIMRSSFHIYEFPMAIWQTCSQRWKWRLWPDFKIAVRVFVDTRACERWISCETIAFLMIFGWCWSPHFCVCVRTRGKANATHWTYVV